METLRSIIPFAALIASIAVIVFFSGCEEPTRTTQSEQINRKQHYSKHTIEGHEYLVFVGPYFVLHNENCPCKQK